MMASVTDVKFSKQELDSYTKASNSCVKLERKSRIIFLLPSHFADLNAGVKETLDSLLLKYDYLFKAIIIGYGKIKVQSKYGSICYGRSKIALRIEADFYLFCPEVGSHLEGRVCKQSAHHIGCLVYKAFNVSIPLHEDGYISGWDYTFGQDVKFIVVQLDLTSGPLPYIKGQLDDDEMKGKHGDSSGSHIGTDSGFDNGTEDDSEREESRKEPTPREETGGGAVASKLEESGMESKGKRQVSHPLNDGVKCASQSPREENVEKSARKPTRRKQRIDSQLDKGDETLVSELLETTKGCDRITNDTERRETAERDPSGEKMRNKSKKKSTESPAKHDSLISQLLKTMEMSFEGDDVNRDHATTATPSKSSGKKRESIGSCAKKANKRNLQGKSALDIDSLASVSCDSLDKPSVLGSLVNESIMETSVVAGKKNIRQSPLKKSSPKKILINDDAHSSSGGPESSGAKRRNATEEKAAGQSSAGREGVLGIVCDVSPKKNSDSENMISKLLGMHEKLLGVSLSSKKSRASRKSTGGAKSPSLIPKVDETKAIAEPSEAEAKEVGGSSVLGNVAIEPEEPTPPKKRGHRKSLTINDSLCHSLGKRKSVGDKISMKARNSDKSSNLKREGVDVPPKKVVESEDIIGKLLSLKKKSLVDNVDITGQSATDCNEGKVLGKRKRESVESAGGPVHKLKRSEQLEKHEYTDAVHSNISPL